ncbi:YqgU-like beta propeller domain-containing protein [Neobacillus vireti]|uniref:YqgU-like 6-bladed beta-propeller domain-containing protein n=1 Tax=Neobacillus vireti LMG 21834 TaxID=1131730 RepID=A0AB94IJ46_9BACI|nr:hypothetical protein [Neobacillus vireti]ETI67045.1 hypothetical protein BAVI_19729 [Neobacillus vireti LMG 21834]
MNRLSYGKFIFILVFLTLLLGACTSKEQPKPKIPVKNEQPRSTLSVGSEWKLPISVPEGEFDRLGGWLSEDEIVYITNLEQTSNVFRYHLQTGKSELIYKTEHPIVNVQISPSKKYILIHSSPSSYEGLITIIDTKGTEKIRESIPSYELAFEWNPYNEEQVLVSTFNEDWTFQIALLDMNKLKMTELSIPQPFIRWMDERKIAFLDWDEDNPTLFAPLIVRDLEKGFEQTLFNQVLQFTTFHGKLMTVTVNEQDRTNAVYSFFDKDLKEYFSFSQPQLTKFSDWLVPFYDYNEHKKQFISFMPVKSGEADSYSAGFELMLYNLKKGSHPTLIMAGMENEPISFSPSGEALLYGNRFEKIIDLNAKKIYELIKK